MAGKIHKTALVSPKAEIADDVFIGPYCTIGDGVILHKGSRLLSHILDGVILHKGSRLLSHILLDGNTEIGENCTIYPFASIGLPPQDLKYKDEKTGVKIGNNNILREYVNIHRASVGGNGLTEIGNSNFLMAYVHIAHDCKIGSSVIMANAATLAGHVIVEDYAVIGGIVAVHQYTRIGAYAMVGGFSGIGQDIPPYTMASGARAKLSYST